MTIQTNFRIDTHPWRGFDDPALPASAYIAEGTITGDASGGEAIIAFLMQIASDPLSSRLYNIEQIMLSKTASTDEVVSGVISNMGHLTPNRPLANRQFNFPMETSAVGFSASNPFIARPIFLGAPSAANLEAGVDFRWQNVLGTVFDATIQGFIWEPRSLLAPGGLQRPTTGPWGS